VEIQEDICFGCEKFLETHISNAMLDSLLDAGGMGAAAIDASSDIIDRRSMTRIKSHGLHIKLLSTATTAYWTIQQIYQPQKFAHNPHSMSVTTSSQPPTTRRSDTLVHEQTEIDLGQLSIAHAQSQAAAYSDASSSPG
jgi:hypothetical protein